MEGHALTDLTQELDIISNRLNSMMATASDRGVTPSPPPPPVDDGFRPFCPSPPPPPPPSADDGFRVVTSRRHRKKNINRDTSPMVVVVRSVNSRFTGRRPSPGPPKKNLHVPKIEPIPESGLEQVRAPIPKLGELASKARPKSPPLTVRDFTNRFKLLAEQREKLGNLSK
jgi:hypothetical protein